MVGQYILKHFFVLELTELQQTHRSANNNLHVSIVLFTLKIQLTHKGVLYQLCSRNITGKQTVTMTAGLRPRRVLIVLTIVTGIVSAPVENPHRV